MWLPARSFDIRALAFPTVVWTQTTGGTPPATFGR